MCGGVYYIHQGNENRVYFPNPAARLPLRTRNGSITLVPWGRREKQAGRLPLGGWARLDAIYAGQWDRWFPQPVKITVSQFMEKDYEGHPRWFDLVPGQFIQGLVARDRSEQRVYVVTIEPDITVAETIHNRWPRILHG